MEGLAALIREHLVTGMELKLYGETTATESNTLVIIIRMKLFAASLSDLVLESKAETNAEGAGSHIHLCHLDFVTLIPS